MRNVGAPSTFLCKYFFPQPSDYYNAYYSSPGPLPCRETFPWNTAAMHIPHHNVMKTRVPETCTYKSCSHFFSLRAVGWGDEEWGEMYAGGNCSGPLSPALFRALFTARVGSRYLVNDMSHWRPRRGFEPGKLFFFALQNSRELHSFSYRTIEQKNCLPFFLVVQNRVSLIQAASDFFSEFESRTKRHFVFGPSKVCENAESKRSWIEDFAFAPWKGITWILLEFSVWAKS